MLPLSTAEIHWAKPTLLFDWAHHQTQPKLDHLPPAPVCSRSDRIDLILRGGYPEIRTLTGRPRQRRYRDYVDTIVDRDVADILKVRKSASTRRLIDQLAARPGNELNIQELTGLIAVQRPTLESYLDVLGKLSLITVLPAWTSGEAGRDIRHPKVHLVDTGIVAALRNINPNAFLADANPAALGAFVETFVYNELRKNLPYQRDHWRLYHWRNARGREIDILAETERTLVGIEIKAAATVSPQDFKHLKWFAEEGPGSTWKFVGIVIYLGDRPLSFGPGLFALPLSVSWAGG